MLGLVNKVYKEAETDMGDFWLSFLEMTDPLVQNVDACHTRHLTEYISSTYDMLPGLMAYDNHEYGRWLPDYWAMLSSLSEEQMAFFSDHFTVNNWTTLHMPVTRSVDRNDYEPQFQA